MPDCHAMPIAVNGEGRIGWQAQCRAGDWNSITHLDRSEAYEDAELHKRYHHHNVAVYGVKAPDA